MSVTLSGKDKAARVPLEYYQGRGWSRGFWAIVVAVALLVVCGGALVLGYWKTAAMPGQVHASHAAWENDCASCHTTLSPTGSGNAFHMFAGNRGRASDQLCQQCHMGSSSQIHHVRQIDAEVESCASCHRDHGGRDAFLSRVSDAKCTSCHADLKNHVKDKEPLSFTPEKGITLFERDHPRFSVGPEGKRQQLSSPSTKDPGRLRFSHKVHLSVGVGANKTFAEIKDQSTRTRYKDIQTHLTGIAPSDADQMQLDCVACHRLDATDDPGRNGPFRTSGDYFPPVTYDQHCKACHPLSFSTLAYENNDPSQLTEIPHHLTPPQVHDFLWGVFTSRALKDKRVREKIISDRPLPGPNLTGEELEKWKAGARRQIGAQVAKAEEFVFAPDVAAAKEALDEPQVDGSARYAFTACGQCHQFETDGDAVVPKKVVPTAVPEVWLPHSRFSHKSHRALQCAECHVKVNESSKSEHILVPDVDNCKQCHSTARTTGGAKLGGVRQDCVTCHRFHHGDQPLAGGGDAARGVEKRLGIKEWLTGK